MIVEFSGDFSKRVNALGRCRNRLPAIPVRGIPSGIAASPPVQREGLTGQFLPRDNERLILGWLSRVDREADENVGVPRTQLPVVVKIEVPRAVPVLVAAARNRDTVAPQARERDPQGDPDLVIDQKIVAEGAGDRLDGQSHPPEARRNSSLRKVVLVDAIHVVMTGITTDLFERLPLNGRTGRNAPGSLSEKGNGGGVNRTLDTGIMRPVL